MPFLAAFFFWLRIRLLKIDSRLKLRYAGGFFIVFLIVLLYWQWFEITHGKSHLLQNIGEIIGITAICLMCCSLVLATRLRVLEPLFGGLDQMYRWHRLTAGIGFLLLIPHIILVLTSLDSAQSQIGDMLGGFGLFGLLILIIFTLVPRFKSLKWLNRVLNYERWYISHRLIGIFVILSIIHGLLDDPNLHASAFLWWTYLIIGIIGIVAYLYKELLAHFVTHDLHYVVTNVGAPNDTTLIVTLEPVASPLQFTPGQFIFVGFGDRVTWERHPFSVASTPNESVLRLSIRALGDYTHNLKQNLKPGVNATVSKPYGMFDYTLGGQRQIWIAGGIGITPFLSWFPDFHENSDRDIDFYYTTVNQSNALFLDEIHAVAEQNPKFRVHTIFSERDGRLTTAQIMKHMDGDIKDLSVFMCGPVTMIESFEREFRKLGVPRDNIHYEDFTFR